MQDSMYGNGHGKTQLQRRTIAMSHMHNVTEALKEKQVRNTLSLLYIIF